MGEIPNSLLKLNVTRFGEALPYLGKIMEMYFGHFWKFLKRKNPWTIQFPIILLAICSSDQVSCPGAGVLKGLSLPRQEFREGGYGP